MHVIWSRYKTHILFSLSALYFIFISLQLIKEKDAHFWDFKVYYHAASSEVDNPYNDEEIFAQQEWKGKKLAYKYPPLTKYLFKPFNTLTYTQALYCYLLLFFGSIVGLVVVWGKMFKLGKDPWHLLLTIVGFNASLYLAMRSGNITIILGFIIWFALLQYINGRYLYFALLILVASLFKVTPLALLSLLVFVKRKESIKPVLIVGVLGLIYAVSNYLTGDEFWHFRHGLKELTDEFGIVSPNMLALSRAVSHHIFNYYLGLANWQQIGDIMFIVILFSVLLTVFKYVYNNKNNIREDKIQQVSLAMLTYFLVLPRVKDYDFFMLIPVVLLLIKNTKISASLLLVIALSISAVYITLPGFKFLFPLMWDYYPLLLVVSFWLMIITNSVAWNNVNNNTSI